MEFDLNTKQITEGYGISMKTEEIEIRRNIKIKRNGGYLLLIWNAPELGKQTIAFDMDKDLDPLIEALRKIKRENDENHRGLHENN